MIYTSVICVLEDCLVSTISGNKFPCGIWDWKIIWPVWNSLKYNRPEKITIISNNDCVKKGITPNDSYWSKICFISHCLKDYTKINFVDYSYSREGNWLDVNDELLAYKSVDPKTLFIGVDYNDLNFSKQLKTDYINVNDLIKLSNEKRTDDLFQRGHLPRVETQS